MTIITLTFTALAILAMFAVARNTPAPHKSRRTR